MFCAHKSSSADISFYASMLRNPEWVRDSGYSLTDFSTNKQIESFLSPQNEGDIKLILKIQESEEKVAFCHFKQKSNEWIEVNGGVIKKYQNSLICVCLYVFTFDKIFHLRPQSKICCAIYEKNIRSLKLNKAMGFRISGQMFYDTRMFYKLCLQKEQFYESPITQRLLKLI